MSSIPVQPHLSSIRFPPFKQVVFWSPNLDCNNYQLVERALGKLTGVQTPCMDVVAKIINVDYFPEYVSKQQIRDALEQIGFTPLVERSDAWVRPGGPDEE